MATVKAGKGELDTRELSTLVQEASVAGGDKHIAIANTADGNFVFKLHGHFTHGQVTGGGLDSLDFSGCIGFGCLFVLANYTPEYSYDVYEGDVSSITAYHGKQVAFEMSGIRYLTLYDFHGPGWSYGIEDLLGGNDTLIGGRRNDHLFGSAGDDTLIGGAGSDELNGGPGKDTADYSGSGASVFADLAAGGNHGGDAQGDTLLEVESLTGSRYADHLSGDEKGNSLDGGKGRDVMAGGPGNDTYTVDRVGDVVIEFEDGGIDTVRAAISFALPKDLESLVLLGALDINGSGNAADNHLLGNSGRNVLTGGDGDDILDGADGHDVLNGGNGDDTYILDDAGELKKSRLDAGIDTVEIGLTYILGANQENLLLSGVADADGTGNRLNNVIIGNAAANVLSGGAGDDYLDGRGGLDTLRVSAGNDTYVIDNITELDVGRIDAGVDLVRARMSYSLGPHQENLELLGTADLAGTGNTLANRLIGNKGANILNGSAGDDLLDGGGGHDRMRGGPGDDTYFVDNADEIDLKVSDPGYDRVFARFNYVLGPGQEELHSLSTEDSYYDWFVGYGNARDNVLGGGSGYDELHGGAGNDVINGDDGSDVLFGDEGKDELDGGNGSDTLYGGAGNDVLRAGNGDVYEYNYLYGDSGDDVLYGGSGYSLLDGGSGRDVLVGGSGDDRFVVDDASEIDRSLEDPGVDTVQASADYMLGPYQENLELTGNAVLGVGNDAANQLIGNSADNVLIGGDGADVLNGRAGRDDLRGGGGDDSYYVDDADDIDRTIMDQGTDTVFSAVSYTLGDGQENLTMTPPLGGAFNEPRNAAGNRFDNVLNGYWRTDTLYGGDGNDLLDGRFGSALYGDDGDDRLIFSPSSSAVDGGAGIDTLMLLGYSWGFSHCFNIERLDLGGALSVQANISAAEVLSMASVTGTFVANTAHQLLIEGDAGDAVYSYRQGWQAAGDVEINGAPYQAYFNTDATAELLVAYGVDVVF